MKREPIYLVYDDFDAPYGEHPEVIAVCSSEEEAIRYIEERIEHAIKKHHHILRPGIEKWYSKDGGPVLTGREDVFVDLKKIRARIKERP